MVKGRARCWREWRNFAREASNLNPLRFKWCYCGWNLRALGEIMRIMKNDLLYFEALTRKHMVAWRSFPVATRRLKQRGNSFVRRNEVRLLHCHFHVFMALDCCGPTEILLQYLHVFSKWKSKALTIEDAGTIWVPNYTCFFFIKLY